MTSNHLSIDTDTAMAVADLDWHVRILDQLEAAQASHASLTERPADEAEAAVWDRVLECHREAVAAYQQVVLEAAKAVTKVAAK